MSRMSEVYGGRFLKGNDLGGRQHLFTIERAAFEKLPDFNNPAQQNDRLVLSFLECGKDLALNATSARVLMAVYGEDETQYLGKQIVVFAEKMNIGGKLLDVVMVRAPRTRPAAPAPAPAQTQVLPPPVDPNGGGGDFDDEIPF